jgi:hypothetical protein
MKKIKLLSVVIFSLIVTGSLFSCRKYTPPPLSEVLPSSIWSGGCSFSIPDSESITNAKYSGSVQILFLKDEANISTDFSCTYKSLDSSYYDDQWNYYWNDKYEYNVNIKGTATYECKGDDVTIKIIKWENNLGEQYGGKEWKGEGISNEYQSTSMFLKNVFGETVIFGRSYY